MPHGEDILSSSRAIKPQSCRQFYLRRRSCQNNDGPNGCRPSERYIPFVRLMINGVVQTINCSFARSARPSSASLVCRYCQLSANIETCGIRPRIMWTVQYIYIYIPVCSLAQHPETWQLAARGEVSRHECQS